MKLFNDLVTAQMKTMDQLLYLQGEVERCEAFKEELVKLQDEAKMKGLEEEIEKMKNELKDIQQTFERQTMEVIESFEKEKKIIHM
jgi:HD superfamily phosphohydrolase YqeK